jgi:hypothetical protein
VPVTIPNMVFTLLRYLFKTFTKKIKVVKDKKQPGNSAKNNQLCLSKSVR